MLHNPLDAMYSIVQADLRYCPDILAGLANSVSCGGEKGCSLEFSVTRSLLFATLRTY